MTYAATIGGVRVASVRLVTCWTGAWFADCELDPDSDPVTLSDVPTGKQTITITPPSGAGSPILLTGTVDPDAQGRWVSTVPLRIIGGLGWSTVLPPQPFHSDGGVSSLTVERATAAAVGETVNDPLPVTLGVDWARLAGPARAIFGDRPWYVDPSGVTQVGQRPPAQPDPSVNLLVWEPLHQHGVLATDVLVLPGTVLSDPRFDGPITVRDVSQTFDSKGTRAEIWCGESQAGRLVATLTNIVRQIAQVGTLKRYRYRIVSQIPKSASYPSRLVLQPVPNSDGSPSDAPPLNPVSVWPGMSGLSAVYATSSQCVVAFPGGDLARPQVESFDGSVLPLEATIDATEIVHVGVSPGVKVKLAEGASDFAGANVMRNGDPVQVMLPPLCPLSGAIGGVPIPPNTLFLTVAFPLPGVAIGGASDVEA